VACRLERHDVVQGDGLKHAAYFVVPVRPKPEDFERPVDLSRRDEAQALAHDRLRDIQARVIAAQSSMESICGRSVTSMPARCIASSTISCFTCNPSERLL